MFTSFFNRTSQQTKKTKRKWESSESVDEEGLVVTDNLQTPPPRKRVCKVQSPQNNSLTPFGKVSTWLRTTAKSTANLFRSFTDKYNLWQGGAENDDSIHSTDMKPSSTKQSSHLREDQAGPSWQTYRGRRESSERTRDYGRTSHHRRSPEEDILTRRQLHEASLLRPRRYDPCKYESNQIREPIRKDSKSIFSSRYRTEIGPSGIDKNSSVRKSKPHDSDKALGHQSIRHVTLLDTVVRLAEREKYKELLAHYTTSKQTNNESSYSNCSQSTETRTYGGTDIGRVSNSRNEQSLLGRSCHIQSPRSNEESATQKEIRVQVSPSNYSPKTIDASRTISTDHITNGFFEPGTTKSRSSRSTKSIDVFDDGWIQKWKQNLSIENIDKERQIAKEKLKLQSLRKEENEKFQELSEEVKARMQGKQSLIEEKVDSFPELTPEMNCMVDKALCRGAPNEALVETATGRITRADIATLGQQNWLNDEIVNGYVQLLAERSKKGGPQVFSFNTFFYPKLLKTGHASLRRWTKKVDLFSKDIVVVPIHLGMHWCLAVIDFKSKVISYYDSLKGENARCLQALRDYLCAESLDKKKQTFDLTGWKCDTPKNIPEQLNGCDCGVFVCKYAEYVSRQAPFDFTQYNMPYFRRRMVYEILSKKLM